MMMTKYPPTGSAAPDAALPPTREFLRHLEEQAIALRRRAAVALLGPLDPWIVQEQLGCTIVTPEAVAAMTPEVRAQVCRVTPQEWSGTGLPMPDGHLMVLLNPDQTIERARVTALEEVAHEHYGHEPTQIITLPNGVIKRSFNPRNEQEAYWTAAAALLPMKAVALAVWRGQTAVALAADYAVSIELAEFRIKILRLWPHYIRNAA